MAATKSFHSPCQASMYSQVRNLLDELVDEHFDDAEHCDFYLKYGSTVLEVSIDAYEEDSALVEVLAFCVQNVPPSLELLRDLLLANSELELGAFSMVGRDIYFTHSFVGRALVAEQFMASLNNVAMVADEYDERIVQKYGGETALERLGRFSRRSRNAGHRA